MYQKLKNKVKGAFSQNKITVLKGISWLTGERVLKLGISIFTGALVARYLQPERYGLLSSVTAFIALFVPLSNFGLNSIILKRATSSDKNDKKYLLPGTFVIKLIGSIVATVLAIIVSLGIGHSKLMFILVLIALTGYLSQTTESIDYLYQARHKPEQIVIRRLIAFTISSAFRIWAVLTSKSLVIIAITYALELVITGLLLMPLLVKEKSFKNIWSVPRKYIKDLMTDAYPIVLASIGMAMYMKIDKVIMPFLSTEHELGIYSAATRLSELWIFIPYSISIVVSPFISKAQNDEKEWLFYKRIQQSQLLINLINISLGIGVSILAPIVIKLIFGDSYLEAVLPLQIHIWSLVFFSMTYLQNIWQVNRGLQKLQISRTIITAIINIALNFILVPRYGAVGAAIATVLSYVYPNFLANALDKRTRGLWNIQVKALFFNIERLKSLVELKGNV